MKTWIALFFLASTAYGQQANISPIPDCSLGFCSGLGVPTFSCNTGQKYAQVDNAGHNYTCTGIPPHWVADAGGGGGANLPAANQVISGDGTGNGIAMPEKGTTMVTGSPNTAVVAWDEDVANGRFDCRNPAYAGGCLGSTPGAAMQAFSDRLICYQAITGKHARTTFPPGDISVGTDTQPTLKLPGGAIYEGAGGWGFATTATTFHSTYNDRTTIEFDQGLTSTTNCSDGIPHTSNLGGGSYDGFAQNGCGTGGCKNVPGDSGSYPLGGPAQVGIVIGDSQYSAGQKAGIYASNNGADGIRTNGLDSHIFQVSGSHNNWYFYDGLDTVGQNYQLGAGECHADIVLGGLDNINVGPFEATGVFATLGSEYGHVAGICWSGGLNNLGHYFSQIEEIGVIHMAGGNVSAHADSGRIDGPRGIGVLELSNGRTTWDNPRVNGACRFDGAGTNSYLVHSVTTATPGSGQAPGTYLITGSDGTTQISVTVGAGGTVTTNPTINVHGRGMANTAPSYTLSAGGTPATFTVTMQPVFMLLHEATGVPAFAACDYVDDQSSGNDTWISPELKDNSFFGASHATGDIASQVAATWIMPHGNDGGDGPIWEPGFVTGGLYTARFQKIIDADQIWSLGGTPIGNTSTLNLATLGGHVQLQNTSATTLTAITGGTMMSDLWISGDGFTTMPQSLGHNCYGADLLLAAGHLYHYLMTDGSVLTLPPVYTEQCDSAFTSYLQPGFSYLTANSALPPTTTQATLDAAGSIAVRPYPPLPAITFTTAGSGSSFSYCYVIEVWAGGGKQTTPKACNSVTPVTVSPTNNIQVHLALPINWTRYKIFMNSTTDPAFTPGVWYDVTSPNGLPQPAQCDLRANVCNAGFGQFITPFTPTDTSTVATANIGLNMTGTYNYDRTNIPASTTTLGVPGQTQIDPINGILWYATSEDTWQSITLGGGGGGGGLVYTSPTLNDIPVVSNAGGLGTVINSHFSDDGTNTYDSENFQLSGNENFQPTGTAISGSNFPSNALQLLTSYYNGTSAVNTNWQIVASIATGTLPATTLNFFSPPEAPTDNFFIGINPSQTATSGANLSSPKLQLGGATWNGSTSLPDTWQLQGVAGTGSNPTSTLTLTHTGTSGTASVNLPQTTITSGAAGITNGGAQWTGGTSLPGTCDVGDFFSLTTGTSASNVMQTCYPANTWNPLASPGSGTFASVQFTGATSGTVTVQAQSVAGTPTITWPTVSGQVALTTAEVVTFSTTPTFTAGDTMSRMVLTGNVTSFTLGATASGSPHTLCFKQGSSSFSVTAPSNVHGFTAIGTTNAKWNCQEFMYDASDSIWLATSPGVQNQ